MAVHAAASIDFRGTGVAYVWRDGEVVLHDAYGEVPLDAGFDTGSNTKLFTAAAVCELAAESSLGLENPLTTFFDGAPDEKGDATVDQLLRHTSGVADLVGPGGVPVTEYDVDAYDYALVERDEFVRRALAAPLRFPPGTSHEYSNAGYTLLGAIVELTSRLPYERAVRELVLLPAGMPRTGYVEPGWRAADLAAGYRGGERWGTPLDHPWLADGPSWNLRAAGGMISTAAEMAHFALAVEESAILSDDARSAFLALYVRESPRGTRVVGHAGSNGIFNALLLWDLDERLVVSVLTSTAEHSASDLGRELFSRARALAL